MNKFQQINVDFADQIYKSLLHKIDRKINDSLEFQYGVPHVHVNLSQLENELLKYEDYLRRLLHHVTELGFESFKIVWDKKLAYHILDLHWNPLYTFV